MLRVLSLPLLVLAALLASATAWSAETRGTAQIYLQRDANGKPVLTDRPSTTAIIERTWQMEREDPVAAQQRADDVRREADAVSERVRRSMALQDRRNVEAEERVRLARLDREAERERLAADDDVGVIVVPSFARRPFVPRRPPHAPRDRDHAKPGPSASRSAAANSRLGSIRGSAAPENR